METSNTFTSAYDALPLALRQLQSAVLRRDGSHQWSARAGVAVCEAQTVVAVKALIAVAAGNVKCKGHGSVRPLTCNNNTRKFLLFLADRHVFAIHLPIHVAVPVGWVFLGVVGLVFKPSAIAGDHDIGVKCVQSIKCGYGFVFHGSTLLKEKTHTAHAQQKISTGVRNAAIEQVEVAAWWEGHDSSRLFGGGLGGGKVDQLGPDGLPVSRAKVLPGNLLVCGLFNLDASGGRYVGINHCQLREIGGRYAQLAGKA